MPGSWAVASLQLTEKRDERVHHFRSSVFLQVARTGTPRFISAPFMLACRRHVAMVTVRQGNGERRCERTARFHIEPRLGERFAWDRADCDAANSNRLEINRNRRSECAQ